MELKFSSVLGGISLINEGFSVVVVVVTGVAKVAVASKLTASPVAAATSVGGKVTFKVAISSAAAETSVSAFVVPTIEAAKVEFVSVVLLADVAVVVLLSSDKKEDLKVEGKLSIGLAEGGSGGSGLFEGLRLIVVAVLEVVLVVVVVVVVVG